MPAMPSLQDILPYQITYPIVPTSQSKVRQHPCRHLSKEDYRYLLTIVDCFSRWPQAIPMNDVSTTMCCRTFLQHWFLQFGVTHEVITDRGAQFTDAAWKQLMAHLDVSTVTTTAYHPQSNGMVERRQQMILSFIRKTTDTLSEQSLWHLKLPEFQTIINSTSSLSHGFSPFFLTFFRHANYPFRSMLSDPVTYNE